MVQTCFTCEQCEVKSVRIGEWCAKSTSAEENHYLQSYLVIAIQKLHQAKRKHEAKTGNQPWHLGYLFLPGRLRCGKVHPVGRLEHELGLRRAIQPPPPPPPPQEVKWGRGVYK